MPQSNLVGVPKVLTSDAVKKPTSTGAAQNHLLLLVQLHLLQVLKKQLLLLLFQNKLLLVLL